MKSTPPAVGIVLATLALPVASFCAPAQDFGHRRDTSHSTIVGNIHLPSSMNRYPRSIQVTIDGANYHQSTTATAGGIFMFTDVPGTDIVIEVRAPGFAITRTEFRAWTVLTDFSVPLGKALDRTREPPPGSSTVNLRTLRVPQKAMKLAARAQEESDKNHLAKAVDWLQQAVQMCPEFVEAWNNLGVTLMRMDKQKEAESAFLRALQTDPRSAPALRNLGLLYLETEKPQEALSVLRKAREVRGENDLYIETYLGHALYGTGQFQEAEAVLEGAIKIKPDFPAALYPLALTQVQLHDYQHARDTFARFLQTSDKGREAEAARSALAKLDNILQQREQGAAE
jgi:Flp pilus assembly protein TadD